MYSSVNDRMRNMTSEKLVRLPEGTDVYPSRPAASRLSVRKPRNRGPTGEAVGSMLVTVRSAEMDRLTGKP
jgi:hypothetical protein